MYLSEKKPKVIILCGGKGGRLQPLTEFIPKTLLPLNKKPVLQHIIEFYKKQNFNQFVLCTGYRSYDIEQFIKKSPLHVEIEISNSGEDASILQRLFDVSDYIEQRAIVTYGDTFIDIDISKMLIAHARSSADITITTTNIQNPFGIIGTTNGGLVTSFEEKPIFKYYIGHMVLEKIALNGVSDSLLKLPDGIGLIQLFNELIRKKKLYTYQHDGLQLTFNTMEEHQKAQDIFVKFYTDFGKTV